MKDFLSLKDSRLNTKYFLTLMLIAFSFSIAVRMIWVDQFSGIDSFHWNNELMINTNDGYYYAEGARDVINGSHEENDLSPVEQSLSKLTAILAKILPISFESLILYMPAFFGSLLVIPIMLISRVFKQDMIGFVAALLGAITWSYYNRTMTGYYDTDMLVVVLPTFFIWGVLFALSHEDSDSFLIAPVFALFAMDWHGGMVHIVNGVFFLTLFYTFIYERKNLYYYRFLSVLVLALTTLPIMIKLLLMIALVSIFHFLKEKLTQRMIIGITILSAITYLVFGGAAWIIGIINNAYVTRALHAADLNLSLHYFGVVNTVREAGHIPFETFANRISGHSITFWLSLIGYILFVFRYRLFVLTLPMVVLGFFALQGGLRFTVFSVPFMAIGVSYLIFLVADKFKIVFADNMKEYAKYGFIVLATIAVLYPNIKHVVNYKVPTVFTKEEVAVLDKLGEIASREDYVLSWWDYGYPIRYYADVKTLVDGAKHSGSVNFPVSYILTNPQKQAANMARLDVEYTEKRFNKKPEDKWASSNVEQMTLDYRYKNTNDFLASLKGDIKLPEKTRDIYLYLPSKMMKILRTIALFSNIDLETGKTKQEFFTYASAGFKDNGDIIDLGNGIKINKKSSEIQIGKRFLKINNFCVTEYDKNGSLHKKIQTIDKNSPISVIFMKSYNTFLVVDKKLFDSTFIQMFVLENYDKKLFEPIILNPFVKVYKLKV